MITNNDKNIFVFGICELIQQKAISDLISVYSLTTLNEESLINFSDNSSTSRYLDEKYEFTIRSIINEKSENLYYCTKVNELSALFTNILEPEKQIYLKTGLYDMLKLFNLFDIYQIDLNKSNYNTSESLQYTEVNKEDVYLHKDKEV